MIRNLYLKILNIVEAILDFFKKDNPKLIWIEKNNIYLKNNIPKKIWMYWDSPQKSDFVDFCIYNAKKKCPDYEIIVLNSKNISKYIELPQFKKGLKTAIVADYIRLSLLKKYGGIWMDASILLTENFDWFLSRMNGFENFVFYTDECTTNFDKPIIENWFIAARENSDFIRDWFSEFQRCCMSDDPNTYYKNYEKNPVIQNIPNTDYLMCYISAAIITAKKSYSILYANSGATGHYYNYKLKWRGLSIITKLFICNKNKVYHPPLIKFTSANRKYPEIFVRNGYFRCKSLFGEQLCKYLNESSK